MRSGGCPGFSMTSKEQIYAICVAVGSSCIATALCELALLMDRGDDQKSNSRTATALLVDFLGGTNGTKWERVGAGKSGSSGRSFSRNWKERSRKRETEVQVEGAGTNEVCTREAPANQALTLSRRFPLLPCFSSLPFLPLLALTSFFFVSFASAFAFAFVYRANLPSFLHLSKVRCPCPPFLDKNESMSSFESESALLCFSSPRIRGVVDRIVYRQRRRDS